MAHKILNHILAFIQRFNEHDITGSAAKATYYLLLSFFPLCLLLLPLFDDTRILTIFLPSSVAVLLEDIVKPELAFQTTSIVIILWSASASIWALMTGIYTAYTGEKKLKLIQGRIRAILLIFILVAALLLCVSVTIFSKSLIYWIIEDFVHLSYGLMNGLRLVILILIIYFIVICLYQFTPNLKVRVRSISIGAIITAIGWVITTWGFEVYMKLFNNYSALYGSIGAFLGLTLWLYIVSIVLLCGAEINVMLSERRNEKEDLNQHF
ncbi:YihY/virulence factor BrkB family protein [Lachnoclostridium phytofermentans]|uniref:Ribonuclease BN n=1 Tax=Lachnoclostridium phytofermentans (strain ATCC 700394 / DSM 18823 / ISDg) TaxID=357809 RepID=A9KNC2_LACP7|nr:YihY/virulence factor BrkB family protein [Lachnoclostridium phytofermentans]ABX43039.1 ribonuclease BN [Lachnoclostridium phytofermentans ISDg]